MVVQQFDCKQTFQTKKRGKAAGYFNIRLEAIEA